MLSKIIKVLSNYILCMHRKQFWYQEIHIEAVVQECSIKKMDACNFIKKETLAQVFSSEFCEISKNTFLHRTPLVASSVHSLSSSFCLLGNACVKDFWYRDITPFGKIKFYRHILGNICVQDKGRLNPIPF